MPDPEPWRFINTLSPWLSANRGVLWAIGVAISAAVVWYELPSHWTLSNRAGRTVCTVREGATRVDVLALCGAPDATGGQPKRGGGGHGFFSMCSAPCDRYGDLLTLYDCEGRLSEVKTALRYQGCIIAQ